MRIVAVVCLTLTGCATTEMLKDTSVGHTGCLQAEMVISDVDADLGRTQWTVQCRGRLFLCSHTVHDIACHERI